MKNLIMSLVMALLVTSPFAFAGDDGHGEDGPVANRDRKNEDLQRELPLLKGKLRSALISLAEMKENIVMSAIGRPRENSPEYKKIRALMFDGLIQDIIESTYDIKQDGPCYDNGKPVQAYAKLNDRGGIICFSVPLLLASDTTTMPALVRTALHEHSHHLGVVEEEARRLGTFMWRFAEVATGVQAGSALNLPFGPQVPIRIKVEFKNSRPGVPLVKLYVPQYYDIPEVQLGKENIPGTEYTATFDVDPANLQFQHLDLIAVSMNPIRDTETYGTPYVRIEVTQNGRIIYERVKNDALITLSPRFHLYWEKQ